MTCLGIKTQRKGLESNLRLAKQLIGHYGNKEYNEVSEVGSSYGQPLRTYPCYSISTAYPTTVGIIQPGTLLLEWSRCQLSVM